MTTDILKETIYDLLNDITYFIDTNDYNNAILYRILLDKAIREWVDKKQSANRTK